MKEDRTFNIRFSSSLYNAWDFDLHGAGHLYVQPGKEYFLENCPRSLYERVVGLVSAMNVKYQLTDNKKGCFNTINCINYDINDPKSLLGRLRTNKITVEEPKVEETVEEEVVEPEVTEEVVEEATEPEVVEEVTEEVEETVEEVTEEEVTEPEVTEEATEDVEEVEEVSISKKAVGAMSKPQLEELATSLGIDSVQTKTKKILKSEIIDKLGL